MCTVTAVRAQARARPHYTTARIAMNHRTNGLRSRARMADGVDGYEEHRMQRSAGSGAHASEVLPALRACINADVAGAGVAGNRHPIAARVGRCADVLFEEIGCELSHDGVRVHGIPRFCGHAAGNWRTLNYGVDHSRLRRFDLMLRRQGRGFPWKMI